MKVENPVIKQAESIAYDFIKDDDLEGMAEEYSSTWDIENDGSNQYKILLSYLNTLEDKEEKDSYLIIEKDGYKIYFYTEGKTIEFEIM